MAATPRYYFNPTEFIANVYRDKYNAANPADAYSGQQSNGSLDSQFITDLFKNGNYSTGNNPENYNQWLTQKALSEYGGDKGKWATANGYQYDPVNNVIAGSDLEEGSAFGQFWKIPATFAALVASGGALSGALAGAGAGAGLGAGALEAGALVGAPGYGTALGSSLGGAAAAGGGSWGVNQMADLGDWQDWSSLLGDSGGGSSVDWNALGQAWENAGAQSSTMNSALSGKEGFAKALLADPATAMQTLSQLPADVLSSMGGASNIVDVLKKALTSGNSNDLASILGKLGEAGLGAYASNQQANSLNELAQQYSNFGAPSRARYEASMTPGFDPNSIPGYAGALDSSSKSILARLSATGGNPYGSPGALIDANKAIVSGTALPAIQEYQRTNLAGGGLANMNAAVPALQQQAIGQDANMYNALGYGLNSLTSKQPDYTELFKALNLGGLA